MKRNTSLFKIPNYPAWFGADTFLLAGSAVHWIIISVMAYQLSGSLPMAGWFATARGVVSALTQITGGTFIDRHDHRALILVQAGSCALLWLAMGLLFIMGQLTFFWFAALCLCSSAIFGFLGGTTNAALIRVVGPERYAEAESVNQGRDAAVNTAGSPLGAALFGISQAFPFFASALFDILAFISALFLHLPKDDVRSDEEVAASSFIADTLEGWRWVLSSRTIMSGVLVAGLVQFAFFAIHQSVNLTLVAQNTDPLLISIANIGTAAGTVVGSVISKKYCNTVAVGKGMAMLLPLTAVAYLPMAMWNTYPVMLLSGCLASIPVPLFSALLNGFIFSKTPIAKQGRTRATIMTALMLFGSLSGALAGEMLPRIGFSGFVLVMAALLLSTAAIAVANPRLRTIPAANEWANVAL